MSHPFSSLHLVGDTGSGRAQSVLAACEGMRLAGGVRQSPSIAAATSAPPVGVELLVLLAPEADDIAAALAASDARGLPRWAVVPCSIEEARSPEYAGADWAVFRLEGTLRYASELLALRRDNARLRGDLGTIGRRLTHDLRTPLNSISTANEALGEPAIATDSAPILRQSISTAVGEAGSLLDRVGVVIFASSRDIELEPVDMEEVLWSARQRLDRRVRAAGATFVTCEQWPVVRGAPALLELVWVNLIANSLEHGGPAPRIAVGWNRRETDTCFWLRDSGPGVAPSQRARLFHPLDRLNELNAPRGYGLSLVQRLIELQCGTTGYEAEPAPGGKFFFTLATPAA